MVAACFRRHDCRLCGSTALTEVLSLAPTPPANAFVAADALDVPQESFPLDVFFCEDCGHVQLLDVVDPKVLFENYVYVSGTSPVFVKHFEDYAAHVIDKYAPPMDGLAVDIGSNDGTLLKFFKDAGMRVLGIDPAKDIAAAATERGLPTLAAFFTPALAEEIKAEHGPAAVIAANNVFAHADDLGGIAEGIRALLADDGVFVFEVSYLVDVYQGTLFDTIYHEHVAYHTVKPLERFFRAHGMEMIAAERVSSHGGSLRGFVQKAGGPRKIEPSVAELIALEHEMGLDSAATLKAFAAKIDKVRDELAGMLKQYKKEGKSIAAFGAPAKATTLMHHFAIGPDFIDFIVDDSPLKQGLYSPGMHIPVVSSEIMYERKPDVVVVLAWNFAEPIIRNHRKFLDGGGHFVVPLPQVRVV